MGLKEWWEEGQEGLVLFFCLFDIRFMQDQGGLVPVKTLCAVFIHIVSSLFPLRINNMNRQ